MKLKPVNRAWGHILPNKRRRLAFALVSGASALWLVLLAIWLEGLPWNLYWWPVLGGIILVSLLLPFVFVPPARLLPLFIGACLVICTSALAATYFIHTERANRPPLPVFSVEASFPTKDKPQSKLWFAHEAWWAWLPDGEGSSVWRREETGWKRQTSLDEWLAKVPGRADVWLDGDGVRAVLVSETQMTIATLKYDAETQAYKGDSVPFVRPIENPSAVEEPVESATITRDSKGIWWIAYDYQNAIWVIHSLSPEGAQWSTPNKLSGLIAYDDIAIIFSVRGFVGVMWAHQSGAATEQVFFRRRLDSSPPEVWDDTVIIAEGYEAAEDHFNVAISPDGVVYVVTKDDKNIVGQPQLVLRRLDADGPWVNIGYADRTDSVMPTRPIALLGGDPLRLYLVHSLYPKNTEKRQDYIVYRSTDLALSELHSTDRILIPAREGENIRNSTSTKQILPADAPWVVLASDKWGNVYEGILNIPASGNRP